MAMAGKRGNWRGANDSILDVIHQQSLFYKQTNQHDYLVDSNQNVGLLQH